MKKLEVFLTKKTLVRQLSVSGKLFCKTNKYICATLSLMMLAVMLNLSVKAQTLDSQFSQGFEADNSGWVDFTSPAPVRVSTGTNGISAKTGNYYGQVVAGNPNTFTRWGGYNSTFPSRGFVTSIDVYLNVGGGYANDTRADFSSAISNTSGAHRRDYIFSFGFYDDAGPYGSGARFVVSASNNSPGNPRDPGRSPFTITSSGWYTFQHRFYDNGSGVLAVDLSILDAGGTVLNTWTLSDASDIIGTTVGGNRYGWFTYNQFPTLAIDNSQRSNFIQQFNVDIDGMASAGSCSASDSAFTTIQAAINNAGTLPGDLVRVCPGTYIEDVSINKASLKVIGSGSGTTTISGAIGGDSATVRIGASNITVANFTITRQGNTVAQWNDPNVNSGGGIAIQGANTNALIRDNLITGNRSGIDINDSSGHTIRNNVIDFNHSGMLFRNRTDNLVVTENFITNNRTVGILFLDASGGSNSPLQTALNSKFNNNNISGNWYGEVVDRQSGGSLPTPGTTNKKDFRFNWFGTTSPVITTANSAEPGYNVHIPVAYGGTATAPSGQPDLAGPASANIVYLPLLTSGTDTNVETVSGRGTNGFQGAASTITVNPSNLNGWSQVAQRTATGSFVVGPGTPTLGFGSYRMTTGAGNSGPDLPQGGAGQGGKAWITTQQYDDIRLADISQLGYSTYVTSSPLSSILTPSLQFQIDLDGNGTRDSAMIFEPYYSTVANGGTQPNVAAGEWQTWNARSGRWWFNNTTTFGCGGCVYPTYDQIIAAYPNAKIVTWFALADGFGTQFVAGQNSAGAPWSNFDGNIDAFVIAVNNPSTTFDFEPGRPSVTIDQASGQPDPTSSSPINFTVTFSEPVTGFTSSDITIGGTAGATTALVTGSGPTYNVAVSGMTGSGTVTASVVDSAAIAVSNGAPSTASTSTDNSVTYFTCNNVSIPTGITVASNTQFLVPINVDSTNGRNILSYDFTMTYNPAVVTPIGVETAGTLSDGWTITTNSSSGTIVVSGFNISPLSGAGTLLNIRFISVGAIGGTSNLNLPSFTFNEGVPCVSTTNGNVTIISGSISGQVTYANAVTTVPVPNVTLNAAGSIPVSTSTNSMGVYSLSGLGTGSYTVTPSKTGQVNGISNSDATAVAQHVVGFTTLNSTQQIAADVSGNGTITSLDASYIAQYVAGFPNPSITGTWKFNPANRSYPNVQTNYTGQDYSAILMGEVTGNWNPATPLYGDRANQDKVNVKGNDEILAPEQVVNVTAPALQQVSNGQNFVIDLTASNTTGENIFGYEFNLLYDPNVIYPQVATPCTSAGTISNGRSVVCNPNTPGLLRVVVFSTTGTPISGAGTLLKLNFTAIGSGGQTSPLTFQNFMFNEGVPQDVTQDGSVFILVPTASNASLSGRVLTPTGDGVSNSRVTITDTTGTARTTLTNSLGYYQFDDLTTGQTYVVSVSSKKHTFTPRTVSISDNITDFDIIADQ